MITIERYDTSHAWAHSIEPNGERIPLKACAAYHRCNEETVFTVTPVDMSFRRFACRRHLGSIVTKIVDEYLMSI